MHFNQSSVTEGYKKSSVSIKIHTHTLMPYRQVDAISAHLLFTENITRRIYFKINAKIIPSSGPKSVPPTAPCQH
ncbi:MAG: hypothetical protein ACI9C4_002806 [Paraglaciecola sp.]|jgi:hypothetical protein